MTASAFSAHSSRQRERQTQRMRSVALALQRKTNATLNDRCFRHWVVYVKAKTTTKSTIRQTRVRSQKRMVRRCFVQWQLQTRHNSILRQKLHRHQETWQFRRQRRVWSAWVFFAQHSLDVKHLIYDRLVICALRDSLQGAWGHWKAHTRHTNDLMDAQRVAQWEHATAERNRMIGTLEDKHERLLLRAAQLGQQNNALRQRVRRLEAQTTASLGVAVASSSSWVAVPATGITALAIHALTSTGCGRSKASEVGHD
ncbi:hypothetical protein PC117_g13120 [Phytophthora cactorum]|nr:hypothetical protein PC117_g13120 [Phytophthora cactorum]KAG3079175.1 hypothetical protein PC122_g12325 [Phytophthora cactorum]